jgi:peptidyl-prolyl cis-trans isomerase-like protein 2
LAHKAEQNNPQAVAKEKSKSDGVNWFGVKVGSNQPTKGATRAGGVGKYISAKRPLEAAADGEERKKQRKLGFGNFEQW